MRFTMEEMENIFEIGRMIELMQNSEMLAEMKDCDSKELFGFALDLATRFEEVYPETEDYYADLDEFVTKEIIKRFGKEE